MFSASVFKRNTLLNLTYLDVVVFVCVSFFEGLTVDILCICAKWAAPTDVNSLFWVYLFAVFDIIKIMAVV